jgi:hypothetical protein
MPWSWKSPKISARLRLAAKQIARPEGARYNRRPKTNDQRLARFGLQHLNSLVELFVLLRRLFLILVSRSGVIFIVG